MTAGIALRSLRAALVAALAVCALLWGLGREATLQWLAAQASARSAGRLELAGVRGSLYGPLRFARIAYRDGARRIEADGVALDWSPLALLVGRVEVDSLEVETLSVGLGELGGAPARPPGDLALPFELSLARVRIGELALRAGERSETVRAIELSARLGRGGHRIELAHARTPWGALRGEASLGARAPYRLSAKASLVRADAPGPYRIGAQASGTLRRIELSAEAERGALRARLTGSVEPFRARGGYAGRLALENALAGRVDQGRIPVWALSLEFAGDPDALKLARVRIDFGAAGVLEGDGAFMDGTLKLALSGRDFDLHGVDRTLRATKLQGELGLELPLASRTLLLKRVRIEQDAARVDLSGELALDAPRALRIEGSLAKVDLARFGRYPESDLNAGFRFAGQLLPAPGGELALELRDSTLGGEPLTGQAKATLAPGRVREIELRLDSGGNRLELRGAYGAPDDRIRLELDAPRLDRIYAGVAGSATASASLAGGLRGALSLDARVRGLRAGRWSIAQGRLRASGTVARHALTLRASGRSLDLNAAAEGGWQAGEGWRGRLTRLETSGELDARLEAPAAVAIGADGFSLEGLALRSGQARLRLDALSRQGARLASRGAASGLSLGLLREVATLPEALASTLRFSADWDISGVPGAPVSWRGQAELRRDSGDLTLKGDVPLALGIERLELGARVADGRITASAEARGKRLGAISARAALGLAADDLRSTPLDATLEAQMPSIAWVAPLAGPSIALEGALHASLSARGTLRAPRISGSLSGEGLALRDAAQGVNLAEGGLRAELRDSKLALQTFTLRAGGGSFEASGTLDLAGDSPEAALDWKAAKLEAIRRPDRQLVLSGSGAISLRAGRLRLSGALAADEGLIILPRREGVTLSDDVVIKGREQEQPRTPARPLLAQLDLELDLGQRFVLKGRGLDARLTGKLALRADEDRLPTASGSIRVADGTYNAYGQRLTIERGIISFSGPLDNPGLDIVAMRKNQTVEAGVAITGTASAPKVSLVSKPEVPDADKLSWLVLGHGLDGTSKAEAGLVTAAAGALLAQGESAALQARISRATGLDEIGVRGGSTGLQDSVVTLGKRLSSKLYLVYERGLFAAGNAVKLRYTLSPRWTVQTQTGGDNAIDIFYNLLFD
jgi:translocation and assembly module TamB